MEINWSHYEAAVKADCVYQTVKEAGLVECSQHCESTTDMCLIFHVQLLTLWCFCKRQQQRSTEN